MDQSDNDPTVISPKTSSVSGVGSDDETVIHKSNTDDETRLASKIEPQTIHETSIDPPTRLMNASVRRMQHYQSFSPGTLIRNRFRLEKEIGRGGMGVVYTARDLRKEEVGDQDSLIAIKLLSEDFKDHPKSLRMLQQETRKTQKLAHPNVVTVYDFDRDGDTVYMTMEYLTGAPLTDYIKAHENIPSDLKEVLPIISDIVHGLEYAHQQGIVHSDLKPGNIFLTDQNVAKILDFGIARAVMISEDEQANEKTSDGSTKQSSTRTVSKAEPEQLFALTPKYASPEMFDDAPPDGKDDIYALACITYQLLSGNHPFNGRPADEARSQGLVPDPISSLSERQWKGLLAGLSFERYARTPSAEEFLSAFLPKRKEPWRWATLSVGVIAVIFTAYFMTRPPQEAPLTEAERLIVNQEIEVAKQHMEVGNLGVALENYKMILALPPYDKSPPGGDFLQHPYNSTATQDLQKLVESIEKQAELAFQDDRLSDAEAFIQAGLDVDKTNTVLIKLREQIKSR